MLTDTQAGYRLRDGWAWSVSQPELTNDSWVSSCCYIGFHAIAHQLAIRSQSGIAAITVLQLQHPILSSQPVVVSASCRSILLLLLLSEPLEY